MKTHRPRSIDLRVETGVEEGTLEHLGAVGQGKSALGVVVRVNTSSLGKLVTLGHLEFISQSVGNDVRD